MFRTVQTQLTPLSQTLQNQLQVGKRLFVQQDVTFTKITLIHLVVYALLNKTYRLLKDVTRASKFVDWLK